MQGPPSSFKVEVFNKEKQLRGQTHLGGDSLNSLSGQGVSREFE